MDYTEMKITSQADDTENEDDLQRLINKYLQFYRKRYNMIISATLKELRCKLKFYGNNTRYQAI